MKHLLFVFTLLTLISFNALSAFESPDNRCRKIIAQLGSTINDPARNLLLHYGEISRFRRPSGREQEVAQYIKGLLDARHISYEQDEVGNLRAVIPGHGKFVYSHSIAVQGHMDIIEALDKSKSNKNHDKIFDQGIFLELGKDGWVHSKNHLTSIGADNTMAVAAIARYITNPPEDMPPLEIFLTVQEETGGDGADKMNLPIHSNYMVNLDFEVDGQVSVGSSGGITINTIVNNLEFEYGYRSFDKEVYGTLKINGLRGGHLGLDIHLPRINGISLTRMILEKMRSLNPNLKIQFLSVQPSEVGGIPNQIEIYYVASPEYLFQTIDRVDFARRLKSEISKILEELIANKSDEDFKNIELMVESSPYSFQNGTYQLGVGSIIKLLEEHPVGIIEYPAVGDIKHEANWVTMGNIGSLKVGGGSIEIKSYVRSTRVAKLTAEHEKVLATIKKIYPDAISTSNVSKIRPWTPSEDRQFGELAGKIFNSEIVVANAGLESAIFVKKKPGLNIVSAGFEVKRIHSAEERFNTRSIDRKLSALDRLIQEATKLGEKQP